MTMIRISRAISTSRHVLVVVRQLSASFMETIEGLPNRAANREFQKNVSATSEQTMMLLHPPGACSAFTRSGSQYPPLGLNQLKSLIGNKRRVDVLEADGFGLTVEETVDALAKSAAKAIGMTVTCGTKPLVHAWSSIVKALDDKYSPLVIVGGPAAAFETSSILRDCPMVDVVVKGEGEVTFPSILEILETIPDPDQCLAALSKLPGVCVRNRPEFNDNKIPTLPPEAFATLQFPDLSASPVHRYRAPDARRLPMITMMTQRGCIAKCAFCNTPQIHGSKIRGWSNEQVVQELLHQKRQHNIKQVSFVDDVFTNRPGGPRRLCELMIERDLELSWYCNVRADQITARMAKAMKNAGCHQVFIGFESGCDEMLWRIRKGETVSDLERGSKILKDAGIDISIGFIVGLPGESDSSVLKSIDLCNRVKPNRVQFTRFTPIPGSELAQSLIRSEPSFSSSPWQSSGFHDRSRGDQVEQWLKLCYDSCKYNPSL